MFQIAKSNKSSCKKCGRGIERSSLRIMEDDDVLMIKLFYHPECFMMMKKNKNGRKVTLDPKLTPNHLKEISQKYKSLLEANNDIDTKKKMMISRSEPKNNKSLVSEPKNNNKRNTTDSQNKQDSDHVRVLKKFGIPPSLVETLMPFQQEGVRFALHECNGRVLIGDEMGLGKTLQSIVFCLGFKREWPALIVTPASVKWNWADELEKWVSNLNPSDINVVKSRTIAGDLTKPITIASYGVFANNSKVVDQITNQNFKVVILDESHYIKNSKSIRTKLLSPILRRAKRVALLSGTPALARPVELWPQVHALRPDLFPKQTNFLNRYCGPRRAPWGMEYKGATNLEELHNILQNFMVRRLKKDVLTQLPPKRRQRVRLDIPPANQALKDAKRIRNELKNVDISSLLSGNALEQQDGDGYDELIDMRKKHTLLLTELYTKTGLAKAKASADFIATSCDSTDKVIVFAHHLDVLDTIETELVRKKIKLMRIDGKTHAKVRHTNVKNFQDPDSQIQVALLGVTSAGQGITLTAASTIIFVEMHWTPGVIIQAEDRAHRIGQINSVNIQYLVAEGTLDDIMWPLIVKKLNTVGKVLDGNNRSAMIAKINKDMTFSDDEEGDEEDGQRMIDSDIEFDEFGEEIKKKEYPKGDMRSWLSNVRSNSWFKEGEEQQTPNKQETKPSKSTLPPPLSSSSSSSSSSFCYPSPRGPTIDLLSEDDDDQVEEKISFVKSTKESRKKPINMQKKKIEAISLFSNDSSSEEEDIIEIPRKKKRKKEIEVDDSIEEFDDVTNEKIFFKVSENTGRVFLFNKENEPLNINFQKETILSESWDEILKQCSKEFLNKHKKTITTFTKQWAQLRAIEQKQLCGKYLHPPVCFELKRLEYENDRKKKETKNRYIENPVGLSTSNNKNTNPCCVECNQPVPAQLVNVGITNFCGIDCYSTYQVKCNGRAIRSNLALLENGICQLCKFNCQAFYNEIKVLTSAERYQKLVGSKFKISKAILEKPVEGYFWQADHINPVSLGGGESDLSNFRTLCTPCHVKETRTLLHKLKFMRKQTTDSSSISQSKQKTINSFFRKS